MSTSPAKLYYLSTGTRATWGSPAAAPADLDEILSAKDLAIPGERSVSDTTDRGTGDVETGDTGKMDAKLDFQCSNRDVCAGRDALRDAYRADTVVALAILDGDQATVGTKGFWCDFKVTKFKEVHPVKDVMAYEVAVVPYASAVAAEWVEVSA